MGPAVRVGLFYLVVSTVGVGWAVVVAFADLRNKPRPGRNVPAPLWVNTLFMLGVSGILGGIAWAQWVNVDAPITAATLLTLAGLVLLNAGTWGLLYTTARRGT